MQTSESQSPATTEQAGVAILLGVLSAQARQLIGPPYSANTRRAYAAARDRFCHAVAAGRSPPAAPEVIANYLTLLSTPPCN